MSTRHHELEAKQFAEALEILKREQRQLRASPWQERFFTLLRIGVYLLGAGAGLLLLLGLSALLLLLLGWDDLAEALSAWLIFVTILAVILLTPVCIAVAVLFVLNIPLLSQFWQQKKLVKELGLQEGLRALWKAERKKKTFTNVLVALAFVLGLAALFFGVWYSLGAPLAEVLPILVIVLVTTAALLATTFMRRRQDHFLVVDKLIASLKEQQSHETAEGASMVIPEQAYEQIARIERSQIYRSRTESIIRFEATESAQFVVHKSHHAIRAQAGLGAAELLKLQNQVDSLGEQPLPEAAVKDEKTGTWRLMVPDTSLEIEYAVDEAQHRIRILSLRPLRGTSESSDGA